MRSLFKSWVDVVAYFTLLAVATSGTLHAPPWAALMGAITLSVTTWGAERWTQVVAKGRDLDAQWHELAGLAWAHGKPALAAWLWLRGSFVWFVYGAHMTHNLFFAGVAYLFGMAVGWFWGVP